MVWACAHVKYKNPGGWVCEAGSGWGAQGRVVPLGLPSTPSQHLGVTPPVTASNAAEFLEGIALAAVPQLSAFQSQTLRCARPGQALPLRACFPPAAHTFGTHPPVHVRPCLQQLALGLLQARGLPPPALQSSGGRAAAQARCCALGRGNSALTLALLPGLCCHAPSRLLTSQRMLTAAKRPQLLTP